MSKFHKYCSCVVCRTETTIQSIKGHYTKYHVVKSYCLECQSPIYTAYKFCNTSCAATFNNRQRAASGWTQTDKQRAAAAKKQPPYTKIKQCKICKKWHSKNGNTCSDVCGTKYLSLRIRESIATGIFNPRNNRGRHKRSYMETSFEQWLTKNCPNLEVIIEQPFPRLDIIKTYFGDFYFPSLSLLIELDGTQHLKTIEYDIERDNYL